MDTIFFAKIFAITFLSMGLAISINVKRFKKIFDGYIKTPALMYVSSFFLLLTGAYVVLSHNIWEGTLAIVVTLIGWSLLLKGVMHMVFPEAVISMAKSFKSPEFYRIAGIVMLLIGLYLGYQSFDITVSV